MINVSVIGSTGSIGRQTLNVIRRHSDRYKVVGLSCCSNVELLEKQINEFRPSVVTVADGSQVNRITEIPNGTELYYGENSMLHAITEDTDVVVVAVMGFVGLQAVLTAIRLKKTVALANKETLVAGGEIVMPLAKRHGVKIVPVDSEHSALFQCLNYDFSKPYKKLILTASGGAFRNLSKEELNYVTAKDALKHPTWLMGKKITVDCATMFNKGLEVIEAMRLYDAPLDKVGVLIHPQSIVHSLVEFEDSSVMAQMAYPSMEIPIQLALSYPERLKTDVPSLDLIGKTLEFFDVDEDKYPCFTLALDSVKQGGVMPCAVSAANETAVSLFLEDSIKFTEIADYVKCVLDGVPNETATEESLARIDKLARNTVLERFNSRI